MFPLVLPAAGPPSSNGPRKAPRGASRARRPPEEWGSCPLSVLTSPQLRFPHQPRCRLRPAAAVPWARAMGSGRSGPPSFGAVHCGPVAGSPACWSRSPAAGSSARVEAPQSRAQSRPQSPPDLRAFRRAGLCPPCSQSYATPFVRRRARCRRRRAATPRAGRAGPSSVRCQPLIPGRVPEACRRPCRWAKCHRGSGVEVPRSPRVTSTCRGLRRRLRETADRRATAACQSWASSPARSAPPPSRPAIPPACPAPMP
mmetsp:Transcript_99289/g.318537  ORF Transcript_99289/g.318537 Transcript_99289/m.318537 type:complete len:257 (-) Transcript_99289:2437-3207(-)